MSGTVSNVVYVGPCERMGSLRHGDTVDVVGSPWRSGGMLVVGVRRSDGYATTVLAADLGPAACSALEHAYRAAVGERMA